MHSLTIRSKQAANVVQQRQPRRWRGRVMGCRRRRWWSCSAGVGNRKSVYQSRRIWNRREKCIVNKYTPDWPELRRSQHGEGPASFTMCTWAVNWISIIAREIYRYYIICRFELCLHRRLLGFCLLRSGGFDFKWDSWGRGFPGTSPATHTIYGLHTIHSRAVEVRVLLLLPS